MLKKILILANIDVDADIHSLRGFEDEMVIQAILILYNYVIALLLDDQMGPSHFTWSDN